MPFPLPPTDNLYKFLAITGLLIILAPQILYWTWEWEYWQKKIEIESSAVAVDREAKRLDALAAGIAKERLDAGGQEPATRERLRNERRELSMLADQYRVKAAELKGKNDLLGVVRERINFLRRMTILGGVGGAAIAIVGFVFWFRRVQVYQDRALRERKRD